MTKGEALAIFTREIVRELLREDEMATPVAAPTPPQPAVEDDNPQPRFDFDESQDYCEHAGILIQRAACPIHGPGAQEAVSAESLDAATGEEPEVAAPIAKARRLAAQRKREEAQGRTYAEELPMRGMEPPGEQPPMTV